MRPPSIRPGNRAQAVDAWRERRRKRHRPVAELRRMDVYTCWPGGSYGGRMRDASTPTAWAAYLRDLAARPGWSIERLARESGINRSTIFRWLKGQGGLMIASVRAIAEGAGVDMSEAMLAAGSVLGPPSIEDDAEMRIIVESSLSPRKKDAMIAHVRARRARDMEETRNLIELAQGES